MKILLTGATGYIGSRVAPRLREQGHELVCLVRSTSRTSDLGTLGAVLATGDVTEPSSLGAAMAGVDAVVHLAAWYEFGIEDRLRMRRINVDGTRNVLEAALAAGVERVIHCSSIVAMGPTGPATAREDHVHPGTFQSAYEQTKHEAHQVASAFRDRGLPVILVMPGAVYGPGDNSMIAQMLHGHLDGRTPIILCPESRMSYVYIEDVARGIVQALEKGRAGESYLLVGDVVSVAQIYELLGTMGVKPPRWRAPSWMSELLVRLEGLRAGALGGRPLISMEAFRMLSVGHWAYDAAKAREELTWETTPFSHGLRVTLEWIQQERKLRL